MEELHTQSGKPYPFGATYTEGGVNFAVYSKNATSVRLEFFDNEDDLNP